VTVVYCRRRNPRRGGAGQVIARVKKFEDPVGRSFVAVFASQHRLSFPGRFPATGKLLEGLFCRFCEDVIASIHHGQAKICAFQRTGFSLLISGLVLARNYKIVKDADSIEIKLISLIVV